MPGGKIVVSRHFGVDIGTKVYDVCRLPFVCKHVGLLPPRFVDCGGERPLGCGVFVYVIEGQCFRIGQYSSIGWWNGDSFGF